MFAAADGIPGGKSGDIGGKEIFARNRNSHTKQAAQQDRIGRLGPRSVDRAYLNAEVVDDSSVFRARCKILNR